MLSVAPNTVQQALRRLVEQGILERRARVGTFVRRSPGRANVALLLFHVPRITPRSISDIAIDALRTELRPSGAQVRVMLMYEPYPSPAQLIAELRAMNVGAVGFLGFYNRERPLIQAIAEVFPAVLMLKELPGIALPCAMPDPREAARLAVDYLAERGRRHIGVSCLNTENDLYMAFSHAVEAELLQRGMPVNKRFWVETSGTPDVERIMARTAAILTGAPRPDALICARDVAERTQQFLHARGEQIGREIDLVAWYSGSKAEELNDPWPLLAWNHAGAAKQCARMVRDIVEGDGVEGAPVVRSQPTLVLPPAAQTVDAVAAKGGGATA